MTKMLTCVTLLAALAWPALAQGQYDQYGQRDWQRTPYGQDQSWQDQQWRDQQYQDRPDQNWRDQQYRTWQDQQWRDQQYRTSQNQQWGDQQMDREQWPPDQFQREFGQPGRQFGQGGARFGGGRYRLEPLGWVAVAYDYDDDGQFDAFEYISAYDLERMRQTGRTRPQMSGMGMREIRGTAGMRGQFAQRGQTRQIEGQIEEIRTLQLRGTEQPHLIARVSTDDGRTAKVDLGPQNQLQQLNLSEGDQITVMGRRGMINQRPMFMAEQVQTDQQQVTIRRERGQRFQQLEGELVSTRTVNFRGQPHIFATLRTDFGQTQRVILGPQEQFRNVSLSEGKNISILARRAPGQQLLAEQVRINGDMINVQHQDQQQRQQQRQQWQPSGSHQTQHFEGQILNTRTQDLNGSPHVIATLQTDGGQTREVILGPQQKFRNVNLTTGKSLSVTAKESQEHQKLMAEQVQVNGHTIQLQQQSDRDQQQSDREWWRTDDSQSQSDSERGY